MFGGNMSSCACTPKYTTPKSCGLEKSASLCVPPKKTAVLIIRFPYLMINDQFPCLTVE